MADLPSARNESAEFQAIVAMHEEQTEKAEAENRRLRAALEYIAGYEVDDRDGHLDALRMQDLAQEALSR